MTIDRKAVRVAIGSVLFNASNYPAKVAPHMPGQDVGPLTQKVTDAVIAHLAAQPVTGTVEWGVWAFGDPGDLQTFETEDAARSYARINSHDGDKIARRTVSEWEEVPNE